MQSAQPSASILQSVLAWQQQRRAASQPQTVRAASLQAGGSQHFHSMPHPQHGLAAMPPAGPPVQRQAGGGGGLSVPWMLPAPQLSAVAPMARFPPPIPAAYAGQLWAPYPRGGDQLSRWQPESLAGDPTQMPSAPQPPAAAAFWQGLPQTPQPPVEAPPLPGTFEAFRLPAPAGGASAFTPGFPPPLPAVLQRRHTWSNVTAPPHNPAANAALALHQPSGFGIWPTQHVRDQVLPRLTNPKASLMSLCKAQSSPWRLRVS